MSAEALWLRTHIHLGCTLQPAALLAIAPYNQPNDENQLGSVVGDDPSFESDAYLQMSVNLVPHRRGSRWHQLLPI